MDVFYYNGLKKIYFNKILKEIITLGSLAKNIKILDFGCGSKQLQILLKKKILNYDKNLNYSDHKSYKKLKFHVVVFNHVLMYMTKYEIEHTFQFLKKKNKNLKIIIGISKVNFISKIAALLSLSLNAHKGIVSNPSIQKKIIFKYFRVITKKNIFFMTDIYYGKIK